MTKLLKSPFAFLFLLAVFCAALPERAWAVPSFTCVDGAFGTIQTQATLTGGTNNVTMNTTGTTITYTGGLSSTGNPTSGTPIVCTGAKLGGNTACSVTCPTTSTITNSGGVLIAAATLNMSSYNFSTSGGNTNLGTTACTGSPVAGAMTSGGQGSLTVNLGATMNATNVDIGGSYGPSNAPSSPITVTLSCVPISSTGGFTATFTSLLGITSTTNMAFGDVTYVSTTLTAADHVDLGTNGAAVYNGNFSYGGKALSAGTVTINNVQNGVTVQVQCDATAVMAKSGASGSKISVTGVKVAAEGSTGTYAGAGSACNGNAGAVATTMVYNSGTANTFYFGGKLDGSTATAFAPGSYSSANTGGTNMTIVVLYQ